MAITFQKIGIISFIGLTMSMANFTYAQSLSECSRGTLKVGPKNVGQAIYFAQDCQNSWKSQNIRMDFAYTENIPDWAFKRAATHFLKRNVQQAKTLKMLDQITQLYQPVKAGDKYSLNYIQEAQTLTLSLNQKTLGQVQAADVNEYFNIWLGTSPFSATLKKQLLD